MPLNGLNAPSAYLRRIYLPGPILISANLQGANLEGAVLTGAYLGGANLRDANLQKADLRSANLEEASYNDSTGFPTGFDPDKAEIIRVKL